MEEMLSAGIGGGGLMYSFHVLSWCITWCITLPALSCVHQSGTSPEPHCSRVFAELQLQSPHLLLEISGWNRGFPASSKVLGLQGAAPILRLSLGPTSSHFFSINLDVLQRGPLGMMIDTLTIQEIPRVLGTLCQEPRAETKYIFLYYTALTSVWKGVLEWRQGKYRDPMKNCFFRSFSCFCSC